MGTSHEFAIAAGVITVMLFIIARILDGIQGELSKLRYLYNAKEAREQDRK